MYAIKEPNVTEKLEQKNEDTKTYWKKQYTIGEILILKEPNRASTLSDFSPGCQNAN